MMGVAFFQDWGDESRFVANRWSPVSALQTNHSNSNQGKQKISSHYPK